jgi:hypothetical protein
MTIWRYFNAGTGVADPTEDSLWTAVKVKGTTLYIYVRETGKLSTAAWASADELVAGGSFLTDNPQPPRTRRLHQAADPARAAVGVGPEHRGRLTVPWRTP